MAIYLLLGLATGVVVAAWIRLRSAFAIFRAPMPTTGPVDIAALPSVSLCIPARNEMHAMTACLESALLSTYPKLEIIVLDDGSRDNTGHLIKSFAHSGVRFVEGTTLPDGWLGKNHALKGLLKESSGSLVLFSDVDTRFSVNTIDQMVAYMQSQNADMVSVLPLRQNTMRASAVFATFRHFWNIVGHTAERPAVASSAWMIKRSVAIEQFDSFNVVARDVRPEKTIARKLGMNGKYRFIISSATLGLSYEKKLSSQYETSFRVYYPDFGAKGIVLRVLLLLLCLLPYVAVVYGLAIQNISLTLTAFIITLGISVCNAWYLGVLRSNNYGLASLCLPFIILREIGLLILSVVMYRRHMIKWKGRPVSID